MSETLPSALEITLTDGGMHFVARLKGSLRDTEVAARLREHGIGPSPLSRCVVTSSVHNGLNIGYANVAKEAAGAAARRHARRHASISMTITLPRSDHPRRLDHYHVLDPDRPALLLPAIARAVRSKGYSVRDHRGSQRDERTDRGGTAGGRSRGRNSFAPRSISALAGAGNLGRSLARGEFLALLHDDAEVLPGWMEALVEAADAHPEAGAIGSMVLNPDGSLQNAGSMLWQDAQTSPRWSGDAAPVSASDPIEAVDYCGTASLLVRASAWDAIGGLDEQIYPAYYVDVDLCLSLWQAGAAVLCQPKSRVHHRRSASTRSVFRHFVVLRNRERFKQKWAAALQQQEPFDDNSPASIARADARAQERWARCRAAGFVPRGSPRAFDPVRQRNEQHARAQALQKAYAQHLRNVVEDIEADRAGAHEWAKSLVREKQELTQAHEELAGRDTGASAGP